jgi:hypothetical protein
LFKVDAKLELLDLSVGSVSFDVCTQLGVSCPLKAGVPAVGTISYDVPSIAPKSTIDAHVTATDDKNVQLACFDAKVQVGSRNPHGMNGNDRTVSANFYFCDIKCSRP